MKNWQRKKIGEICEVIGGGTPNTSINQYWNNEIIWVTPKDLGQLDGFSISDSSKKISKLGLSKSSAKLLPKGSVILSSRAPIGYVAIAEVELATNQGCRNFVCSDIILNKYLAYFLLSKKDYLNDLGGGSTFKEVSGSKLKDVIIDFPEIIEQKRIVKVLDEVFENIEKAKQNTEKNLCNSKEIFNSYLEAIFEKNSMNQVKKTLGEIASIKGGKRVPKGFKLQSEVTNYPYIRVADFNDYGSIDINNIKYITEKVFNEIKNYTISKNDLYISIAGTIGKTGIIPEELDGANLTENACRLIFKENIDKKLIYYFTKTKSFEIQSGLNTRKTAMPKLALNRLSTISLSFPKSRSEQVAMVANLDALSAETKKVEANYKKKLVLLEELKKSILAKAFRGEL